MSSQETFAVVAATLAAAVIRNQNAATAEAAVKTYREVAAALQDQPAKK